MLNLTANHPSFSPPPIPPQSSVSSSSSSSSLPTYEQALQTLVDVFINNSSSDNHNNYRSMTVDQLATLLRRHVGNVNQTCDYILSSTSNASTSTSTNTNGSTEADDNEIVWCYDDDTVWRRYSSYDTQILETSYQQAWQQQQQNQQQQPHLQRITLQDGKYSIDFTTMTQMNTSTRYQRRIQRLDPSIKYNNNSDPVDRNVNRLSTTAATAAATVVPVATAIPNNAVDTTATTTLPIATVIQTNPLPPTSGQTSALTSAPTSAPTLPQQQQEQQQQQRRQASPPRLYHPQQPPQQQLQQPPVQQWHPHPHMPQPQQQQPQQRLSNHHNSQQPPPLTQPAPHQPLYYYSKIPFHGDVRQGQITFPANVAIQIVQHPNMAASTNNIVDTANRNNGWLFGRYGPNNGWFPIQALQLASPAQQQQPPSAAATSLSPSQGQIQLQTQATASAVGNPNYKLPSHPTTSHSQYQPQQQQPQQQQQQQQPISQQQSQSQSKPTTATISSEDVLQLYNRGNTMISPVTNDTPVTSSLVQTTAPPSNNAASSSSAMSSPSPPSSANGTPLIHHGIPPTAPTTSVQTTTQSTTTSSSTSPQPSSSSTSQPPSSSSSSSSEAKLLDDIEKEIFQIQQSKTSMKPEVCTELITKLCCKLDSIDVSSETNLRKKRKELLQLAERIDPSSTSSTTMTERTILMTTTQTSTSATNGSMTSFTATPPDPPTATEIPQRSIIGGGEDNQVNERTTTNADLISSLFGQHDEALHLQSAASVTPNPLSHQGNSEQQVHNENKDLPTATPMAPMKSPPTSNAVDATRPPQQLPPSPSISASDILQMYSIGNTNNTNIPPDKQNSTTEEANNDTVDLLATPPENADPRTMPMTAQNPFEMDANTLNTMGQPVASLSMSSDADSNGGVIDRSTTGNQTPVTTTASMPQVVSSPPEQVSTVSTDTVPMNQPITYQIDHHNTTTITMPSPPQSSSMDLLQQQQQQQAPELQHQDRQFENSDGHTYHQEKTTRQSHAYQPAIARYEFSGDPNQKQISFPMGASLLVNQNETSSGWIRGQYNGCIGWLPSNYVVIQQQNDVDASLAFDRSIETQGISQQYEHQPASIDTPPLSQSMDETPSDFETMTVMGGHADNVSPRITLTNVTKQPWQVEQSASDGAEHNNIGSDEPKSTKTSSSEKVRKNNKTKIGSKKKKVSPNANPKSGKVVDESIARTKQKDTNENGVNRNKNRKASPKRADATKERVPPKDKAAKPATKKKPTKDLKAQDTSGRKQVKSGTKKKVKSESKLEFSKGGGS